MHLGASLLSLILSSRLVSSSFYDNPKLELPPEGGTPLDELKAKWDLEVC